MASAPDVLLLWLQSVVNAAVRLVFSAKKFDLTTPLLCELHWLKVPERVRFPVCLLTYRCLTGTAPHYLAETICPVFNRGARQYLRSAESSTLLVPSTRRSTLGDRSFPVAAARAWNTTTTCSESAFSSRLPPRSEDSSVPVVVSWCDLTMYQLVRRSVLICHHVLAATNWF